MLFIESTERLAFRGEDEAALEILTGQAGNALKASEQEAAVAELRPTRKTLGPLLYQQSLQSSPDQMTL